MTAPKEWPQEELREKVARVMHTTYCIEFGGLPEGAASLWSGMTEPFKQSWMRRADAALAALAPFVAQIKAAAFKRGAEAMREANAAVVDAHAAAAKRCSEEGDVIYRIRAEFLANSYAIQSAADDVRVTPIPEDKP